MPGASFQFQWSKRGCLIDVGRLFKRGVYSRNLSLRGRRSKGKVKESCARPPPPGMLFLFLFKRLPRRLPAVLKGCLACLA